MPRRVRGVKGSNDSSDNKDAGIVDSDFVLLDDLVYAPVHALAESNQKLREHIVEDIREMGTVKQDGTDEVIHLDNMNIAYDKVSQDGDDGYSVDNLQLQVPVLSIVPITNLTMEKAKIDFSAEVRTEVDDDGNTKINGRICAPEARESNYLPRVSYHMEVKSIPATEGIMRLTDLLNSNQISKQIDATPVALNGCLRSDNEKDTWQYVSNLRAEVKRLKQLYQKITDTLNEQENLAQLSAESPENDTYEFDKSTYVKAQSDIMNRIMKTQDEILSIEVKEGLSDDE